MIQKKEKILSTKVFIAIIILIIMGLFAVVIRDLPSARIRRAEEAIKEGDYNHALELSIPLLEKPKYASEAEKVMYETYYRQGKELVDMNKMGSAEKVLSVIPPDSEWYKPSREPLIKSYAGLQKWGKAESVFDEYYDELNMQDLQMVVILGKTYFYRDNLQQAQNVFEKVLSNNPDNEEALKHKALVHARYGLWDRALSFVDRGLEHHPDSTEWQIMKGALLAEKEDFEQASHVLQEVLQKHPDNIQAAFFWLIVARQKEDVDREKVEKYLQKIQEADLSLDAPFFLENWSQSAEPDMPSF